ncbi:hypothetical protein TKK_0012288 [Trichogramma kaykai]
MEQQRSFRDDETAAEESSACDNEEACIESNALGILGQIDCLYRSRVGELEARLDLDDPQRVKLKLKIMNDWVKDLGEQNAMLVQTVHELEQAAICRVKSLEDQLQSTTSLISNNITNSSKSEKDLNTLSTRICQLESEQDCMQSKITSLKSDLDSLLKLMKRGQLDNNWNLDGFIFHEIKPSDIPLPNCKCSQGNYKTDDHENSNLIAELQENESKLLLYQNELEDKICILEKQVDAKEDIIQRFSDELEKLRDSLQKNYISKNDCSSYSSNINTDCGITSSTDSCYIDEVANVRKQLQNSEQKLKKITHDYDCEIYELKKVLKEKCNELDSICARYKCFEQETAEAHEALTQEIAEKHDTIMTLKKEIACLQNKLIETEKAAQLKDDVIIQLRKDLQTANQKAKTSTRKVKICPEPLENLEKNTDGGTLRDVTKQLEDCKRLLEVKDNEIKMFKKELSEKSSHVYSEKDNSNFHGSPNVSEDDIIPYLMNIIESTEKERDIILNLKSEYEKVLENLKQTKSIYENDVSLANEKLEDILSCLYNYRTEVINQDNCSAKNFIVTVENKIVYIQKLFQSQCETCVKENVVQKIKDIISIVSPGILKLAKMFENKNKSLPLIKTMAKNYKSKKIANDVKKENEIEHKEIFAAIVQQFRMMEEFRICTVEVQAATEDLREEISEIISNLNSRHSKYVALDQMITQVQDYISVAKDRVIEIVNCLELQNEERNRHNRRISNNRVRLKDLKNQLNTSQLDLSKFLNNVQSDMQQNGPFGHPDIHACEDLITSVVEEVELIVNNLQAFQDNECCTVSSMTKLKDHLVSMEDHVRGLKNKSDKILEENEESHKSFIEEEKLLEKYECEVDNCHTKMQDVLQSIIDVRDQMNEYGCIKESTNSFESTNEAIKLKGDLRKVKKECEELKSKLSRTSQLTKEPRKTVDLQSQIIGLQEQIKSLQSQNKCTQEANVHLKRSLEELEKELSYSQVKAAEYRKGSSSECFELKKKIFELENSVRGKKDTENNFKCLGNSDARKMKLLDYTFKDSVLRHSLPGAYDNLPQMFRLLQEAIHTMSSGLQRLNSELTELLPKGSPVDYNDSVSCAVEKISEYIDSVKNCSFEVEKAKSALYSKDKLMENMEKIIKIQKDSIAISQTEVEDLHKALQEKIVEKAKVVTQYEDEKSQLSKQIEMQEQTIKNLKEIVINSKSRIEQLTSRAATDNRKKDATIKTLQLNLTETQSQYDDCYGEASKQEALLELQRDSKELSYLLNKCHLLKFETDKLERAKSLLNDRCEKLELSYQKAKQEIERLRQDLEDSCNKLSIESEYKIKNLKTENEALNSIIRAYKSDLDLIKEEMKKLGLVDFSIASIKQGINFMRVENEQFKNDSERSKMTIKDLKLANECLTKTLHDFKVGKDAAVIKFKEKIMRLQHEIALKNEKIKSLGTQVGYGETIIDEQLDLIKDQSSKLFYHEHYVNGYYKELDSSKEVVSVLRNHLDSLQEILKEKNDCINKIKEENLILRNNNDLLMVELNLQEQKEKNEVSFMQQQLKFAKTQLVETQQNYEKAVQELKKKEEYLIQLATKSNPVEQPQTIATPDICKCVTRGIEEELKNTQEAVQTLNKELEDVREKHSLMKIALSEAQNKLSTVSSKLETSERSCQRQKDESMLLEKKLACINQKFQSCTDKNEELIKQNKALEDCNNKSLEELEDMQSSLVELRNECDTKTQALDNVSQELERMKVSRLEVCEESKNVLEWVRRWMQEQKQRVKGLQDELRDKHKHLKRANADKKKCILAMRQVRRVNKMLKKRLKYIHKRRQIISYSNAYCQQNKSQVKPSVDHGQINGLSHTTCSYQMHAHDSKSIYTILRKECNDRQNHAVDKLQTKGNYWWFPTLEHILREMPKTVKFNRNIISDNKILDESIDCGYMTSSSK